MRSFLFAVAAVAALVNPSFAAELRGVITRDSKPVAGAFVTAHDSTRAVRRSVRTGSDGRYRLSLPAGHHAITARARGFEPVTAAVSLTHAGATVNLTLGGAADAIAEAPSRAFLGVLPESEEKRRFIVDCMGCHSISARNLIGVDGKPHDEEGWKEAVDLMLSFAGHDTPFPILPPDRTSDRTAAYLVKYLTAQAIEKAARDVKPLPAAGVPYRVTEWDIPHQWDFPHDVMLDRDGRLLVTGMFSGVMYVLNPEDGSFSSVEIPIKMANPRALDIDAGGNWWVLCGMPGKIARYRVGDKAWDFYDVGMYGHSIGVDRDNRAWFNGHFTRDPVQFGYVDAATGGTKTLEAPATPMPKEQGSPIPYELRVGPDGAVWMGELAGNRLLRHDPVAGTTETFDMPAAHSGPRRFDVGPDGVVWVPEFAAGKLARFDPKTKTFREFDLPVSDSLPYCARVDAARGVVWISQCAADALVRFDIATETFTEFELPARNAFIRHLDIDKETGAVWGAYSHSPNLDMRVVRLTLE